MDNKTILQSYANYKGKAWFVSTVNRTYGIPAAGGSVPGEETLVWEYEYETKELGKIVWQGEGLQDHHKVCTSLCRTGEVPEDD